MQRCMLFLKMFWRISKCFWDESDKSEEMVSNLELKI